ncbi:MAG: DNA repair protein RecN [Clostridia bacterium]|nr:DNA repair protein RecN [Clostridia bacterium]
MLFALHIQNIALLDDAQIEFGNGFNVLSGETGAGKSILISSINLLLGDRANRELIRHDADRAEVSGIFYVETEAQREALADLGITPEEDGALCLSRQLLKDGKNICRIGGRTATLSELREAGNLLVNIHGQHDSQALLNPTCHIRFLDSFLKAEGKTALVAYQEAYQSWQSLSKELEDFFVDEAEKLRKIDLLSYEYNEIRAAGLSPEEEDELTAKRDMIQHKKHLESATSAALSALCDSRDGMDALGALSISAKELTDAAGYDASLVTLSEKAELLYEEVQDLSRNLRNYFERLTEDELPIDEIEARLDVIYHLKRKYGGSIEAVIAHGTACENELSRLENADAQKAKLEEDVKEAQKTAESLARSLSTLRKNAISHIEDSINSVLHFLNMPDADFKVVLTECPLNKNGAEQVGFYIRTNSGEDYAPLSKIISGGELSRIMLAIQSVLTDGDVADTLIFDEIDTGVSGSAAQKIGRKLKALAGKKQVLCVTHLAQIAAMADSHFLIEKSTEDGRTRTDVLPLSHDARIRELARIISGDAVSETTLKQAEELIAYGDAND